MNKLYDRIDFVNNTTPALNQTNLNKMSKAVDDIDDRVVDIAGTVMETVPQIQEDIAEAAELVADAEAITTHPPRIGENDDHWWVWDTSTNAYVDSGIDAGVSVSVGTTTTLPAGSSATVTNSGTATDPVFDFGIPQGAAGQDGDDGDDGVSPEVTITSITGGHEVKITDADHPSGQSFNVMDGQDGSAGVGVPSGGTTGQVLAKASGTDYDTEWVNASGGSGGHTILDSSGTAMTQRTNLQFDGADVTDDSSNDKTIVTTTPQSMIGDAWASGQAYAVGDYRIDENVLYKCKTAHTSSASNRPPYASYWDAVSVASELVKIGGQLSDVYFLYKNGNEPYGTFALSTSGTLTHGETLTKNSNNMVFSSSFVDGRHFANGFLRIALPNEIKTCSTFAVRISSYTKNAGTGNVISMWFITTNYDTWDVVNDANKLLAYTEITGTGTFLLQTNAVGDYLGLACPNSAQGGNMSVTIAEFMAIR